MGVILQLKIAVEWISPEIWRRFLVKDKISFEDLHNIIQVIMGWENYHMFEFQVGDEVITSDEEEPFNAAESCLHKLVESPEFHKMMEQEDLSRGSASLDVDKLNKILKNAEKNQTKSKFNVAAKIGELIKSEGQKFAYLYDFGDNWVHSIIVEKILDEKEAGGAPVCLAGERACPPEDCGSVEGYYELLKIQKNKKHPRYREMIAEWLGEDFDFEVFDIKMVNKELKTIAGIK